MLQVLPGILPPNQLTEARRLLDAADWVDGKTTLLRCIAGFEGIAAGEIRVQGRTVSSPEHRVPPEQRQIGMVFQDYALFPHLTVAGNIAFGLTSLGADQRQTRVGELLSTVGLDGLGRKFPHELSG